MTPRGAWNDAPPAARRKGKGKLAVLLVSGGCLLALLLCGGMCAAIAALFQGTMRQSEAFTRAVEIARGDPRILEAFGGSIEPGFFLMGNVAFKNGAGNAELHIPVSGPGGEGRIHVIASRPDSATRWTIEKLVVTKGSEEWDLTANGAL